MWRGYFSQDCVCGTRRIHVRMWSWCGPNVNKNRSEFLRLFLGVHVHVTVIMEWLPRKQCVRGGVEGGCFGDRCIQMKDLSSWDPAVLMWGRHICSQIHYIHILMRSSYEDYWVLLFCRTSCLKTLIESSGATKQKQWGEITRQTTLEFGSQDAILKIKHYRIWIPNSFMFSGRNEHNHNEIKYVL